MNEPPAADSDSEIDAQAAVWFARMRSEERTRADQAGFGDWISEDPRRRVAFDEVTANWQAAGAVARDPQFRARPSGIVTPSAPALRRRHAMVAFAAAAAAGGAAWWAVTAPSEVYRSAIGEIRQITLNDGSRLVLDTDTELSVHFSEGRRAIQLRRGRAHFAVAKDASRPFAVSAGGRQVLATGTAFDVTRYGERTSILLLEGAVRVERRSPLGPEAIADLGAPGDQLIFGAGNSVRRDRAYIAKMVAWQKRELVLDEDLLSEAVAELNRYTRRPIVLASDFGKARVSGVYSIDDPAAFATSVAVLFGGRVREEADRIIVSN